MSRVDKRARADAVPWYPAQIPRGRVLALVSKTV